MNLLFIAPATNLATNAEFMRIASGNQVEVIDGLLDRAGLDRALHSITAQAVHFAGHASKSVLELSDGALDAADLVSMLDRQRNASFFFVNGCNSLSVGTAIHNAMHLPVICHDAPIDDRAAVRFAETFYRRYRQTQNVTQSFDAARETLLRIYPAQAAIPVLINGDMATKTAVDDCMNYLQQELIGVFDHFNTRLDAIDARLGVFEAMLDQNERISVTTKVIIALLAVAAFAQVANSILTGLLVH